MVELTSIGFPPETKVVITQTSGKGQKISPVKLFDKIEVGKPLPHSMVRKVVEKIYLASQNMLIVHTDGDDYQLTIQA